MSTSAVSLSARRSLWVSLLGWLIIVGSAMLSIISLISLLMILAGSHGTQNTELSGFLLIVVAPPVSFVAGIGLVRRWRWAWLYLVAGLLLAIGLQVFEMTRPPRPAMTTTTLPSGVKHTTLNSGPQYSLPLTLVLGGLLIFALSPGVRREFGISRKNLPPPLPSARTAQPIEENAPVSSAATAVPSFPAAAAPVEKKGGMWTYIVVLLAVAGFMGWEAKGGFEKGKISTPSTKGAWSHTVERKTNPLQFWASMSIHLVLGAGSLGLATWLAALELRSPRVTQNVTRS